MTEETIQSTKMERDREKRERERRAAPLPSCLRVWFGRQHGIQKGKIKKEINICYMSFNV